MPDQDTLGAWDYAELERLHVCDDVLLASQPRPQDLLLLQKAGVRTVLNFRRHEEMDFDEASIVRTLGMEYRELPWRGPEQLTDEIFDEGRRLLSEEQRPLLVHCSSGNRVGPIWIAWRVLDGGIPLEQAVQEAELAGMHTEAYAEKARAYVASRGG